MVRRFPQRNSRVMLSAINITPLLHLAFAHLIIFIIQTPFLEKALELKLPKAGGQGDSKLTKRDIRTVEIDPKGAYSMDKRALKLDQLIPQLAADARANPNLVVYIRAD